MFIRSYSASPLILVRRELDSIKASEISGRNRWPGMSSGDLAVLMKMIHVDIDGDSF